MMVMMLMTIDDDIIMFVVLYFWAHQLSLVASAWMTPVAMIRRQRLVHMSMLVVCYTATYVWSLNLSPLFAMQEYIVSIHNVKCKVIPVGQYVSLSQY